MKKKVKLVRKPRTRSLFNTGTRPINQKKTTLEKSSTRKIARKTGIQQRKEEHSYEELIGLNVYRKA